MAENIFPDELDRWYNHSPYGKQLNIDGLDCKELKTWYSYPEFNQSLGFYVFLVEFSGIRFDFTLVPQNL
jgi:hypothetical protein